jgi:hypothetical protein
LSGRRALHPRDSASVAALLRLPVYWTNRTSPHPEPTRSFLEASRPAALPKLVKAWLESSRFDELRLVPGLKLEGELEYDPARPRRLVLDFLSTIPGLQPGEKRPFWSLVAFLEAVRYSHPEFLRPSGDYDSWLIRDVHRDEFLRGFEHWEDVEGALLRFMLTGPLHWLGILDLASPAPEEEVSAFRFSAWAADLLAWQATEAACPKRSHPIQAVQMAGLTSTAWRRAQSATSWLVSAPGKCKQKDAYRYRLTPSSLERSRQG